MSSILQTTAQFPLSSPEQCSVSLGMRFLEILIHWSSCALKSKRTPVTVGRKRQNCRSHGLQEPSQGLGLCLRSKVEGIRKVEGERRTVNFHLLFGSTQIHSLQKYVSNQEAALHFRCESWRERLQVDFLSLTNFSANRNPAYYKQARFELFAKLFELAGDIPSKCHPHHFKSK